MGFFDGGGKAAKFNAVNEGVSGYIVGQLGPDGRTVPYKETQQTDYRTKEPSFYKDGNPIMQAEVELQTDDRLDSDDDGRRRLYVNKTRMRRAIQEALRNAGSRDLQVGGALTVWMTGEEPSKGGGDPAKTFAATYAPPAGSLATEPAAAPAAHAAPVAPPAPVAASAPVAPPVPVAASAPVAPPVPVAAPPVPVAAPPVPVAAPPVPVAGPPAPVAAPPVPVATPVAPPATPAPVPDPWANAAPAAAESDLPF